MQNYCVICFDDIEESDKAKKMYFNCDCYLNFHHDCILLWMDRETTCPMCRCVMNDVDHIVEMKIKRCFGLIIIFVVTMITLLIIVSGILYDINQN